MSQWIRSEKGRTVIGYTAVVVVAGIGFAQTLPHTFGLSKYQEFMQMFRSGIEVPVSPKLMTLADKVLVDCKMSEKDVRYLKFFTVFGLDTFSAGSTKLNKGAIVGIPYNFSYEDVSDVDLSILKVNVDRDEGDLDYESGPGKKLISSIVLSERAKKFAIAREVCLCSTYKNFVGGTATSMTLLSGYLLGMNLNAKFNFGKLRAWLRGTAFTVCGLFGLVSCLMLNDAFSIYYDYKADRLAANISHEYALGGVEYYEKQVLRNKCLRRVMGSKGEKYYTANGNFQTLIRTKGLPLNARLDNLKERLEKYEDEDEKV